MIYLKDDIPPKHPIHGDIWLNPHDNQTYVYYDYTWFNVKKLTIRIKDEIPCGKETWYKILIFKEEIKSWIEKQPKKLWIKVHNEGYVYGVDAKLLAMILLKWS